jgi:hypothetical protein
MQNPPVNATPISNNAGAIVFTNSPNAFQNVTLSDHSALIHNGYSLSSIGVVCGIFALGTVFGICITYLFLGDKRKE